MASPTSGSRPTAWQTYLQNNQNQKTVSSIEDTRAREAAIQKQYTTASAAVSSAQKAVDDAKTHVEGSFAAREAAAAAYNASPTELNYGVLQGAISTLETDQNVLNSANTALEKAKTALISATTARTKLISNGTTKPKSTTSTSQTTSTSTSTSTTKPKANNPIMYNIPMVREAYLGSSGPQADSMADSSNLKNTFSKGRIIGSTLFPSLESSVQVPAGKTADNNIYGFKFLYNPPSVDMSWGTLGNVSPYFLSSGDSQSLMTGLQSTVDFTLFLNRSLDMNFVDENGFAYPNTASNGALVSSANIRENRVGASVYKNPWPTSSLPSNEELKQIYHRGTMYDLEYLFKVTGGKYVTHNSPLMGIPTADVGWINPIPVELYLGNGLHYLVQVVQLDVTHTMFNERMVPVMSQVSITCRRYYDSVSPATGTTSSTNLFGNS